MANIIGLKQQQEALKKVRSALKEVETMNAFLLAQNSSGQYTLSFTDETGKKISTDIVASKEEVDNLIAKYKKGMKDYIFTLAEEFHIGLDLEDEKILEYI